MTLFQLEIVGSHIVLIHLHSVLQELVARGRGKEQVVHVVTDGETSVQHVTLIAVHNGRSGILDGLISRNNGGKWPELTIGKTILIDILVISRPVELQLLIGLEDEMYLATCLKTLVIALVEILILDKAFQTTVETCNGKCQLIRGTMEVSQFDITVKARADAQIDICTLIAHRILRIDAHKSALGVLAVKRPLGTAKYIHTIEHVEMVVICGL